MGPEKARSNAEEFSPIERELIVLKALTNSLDSMLNNALLTLRGTDPDTQILFNGWIHQRLFNILLVDFLGKPDLAGLLVPGFEGSYLEVLSGICSSPSIGDRDSVGDLAEATKHLSSWLKTEMKVVVWLPSVDQEISLTIRRHDFIWITGNVTEHNFPRLTRVSSKSTEIFRQNNVEINLHQGPHNPGRVLRGSEATNSAAAIPALRLMSAKTPRSSLMIAGRVIPKILP